MPVTEPLTGLSTGSAHDFRVGATNAVGTTLGTILSFDTSAGPTAATPGGHVDHRDFGDTQRQRQPRGDRDIGRVRLRHRPGADDRDHHHHRPVDRQRDDRRGRHRGAERPSAGDEVLRRGDGHQRRWHDHGGIQSFTTLTPPAATTSTTATDVTSTAATLNGSVNPEGTATSVVFVYGTDPALMTGTTTTTAQSIGSGTTAAAVTAALSGLQPGTKYYDEVMATNAGGTTTGGIQSFTTATPPNVQTIDVGTADNAAAWSITGARGSAYRRSRWAAASASPATDSGPARLSPAAAWTPFDGFGYADRLQSAVQCDERRLDVHPGSLVTTGRCSSSNRQ